MIIKLDELKQMINEYLELDDVLHESAAPLENTQETRLMARRWSELRQQLMEVSRAE